LEREGILDADARAEIDQAAIARVDAAVAFAEASPFPKPESLYEDVYALGEQARGAYHLMDEPSGGRSDTDGRAAQAQGPRG